MWSVSESDTHMFLKASCAALTSGLGGLPLLIYDDLGSEIKALALLCAAGMMCGCCFGLFVEAYELEQSISCVFIWGMGGALVIYLVGEFIQSLPGLQIANLKGSQAKKAIVLIFSMAIHSIGEGISVGVAAKSQHVKLLNTVVVFSLAVHNIPEGLAISLILRHRGMSVLQSCLFAVLANIPQPIAAILVYKYYGSYGTDSLSLGFDR
eukprot:UN30434